MTGRGSAGAPVIRRGRCVVVHPTRTLLRTPRTSEEDTAMLLAPRQLQRHGMTGSVPYYGGRLTPGHVYGIQQAARERAAAPPRPAAAQPPPSQPPPLRNQRTPKAVLDSLTYLRDTGVISPQEFDDLRRRAGL
jgi:hypothetical protein